MAKQTKQSGAPRAPITSGGWHGFTQKEKRAHYTAVARGDKPVKANSKYSEHDQIIYASGQRDARNEAARITAYKNATEAERAAYAEKHRAEQAAYRNRRAELSELNASRVIQHPDGTFTIC